MNAKIIKFFELIGLWKPTPVVLPPTPLELLKQQLSLRNGEFKKGILKKADMDARAKLSTFLAKRDQGEAGVQPEEAKGLFQEILKQVELLVFIYHEKNPKPASMEEYERLLEELVKSLVLISEPASGVISKMESYLTGFEEFLLLEEAHGVWRFDIGENDRWIKLPLLSTLEKNPPRKAQAAREIVKVFTKVEQLALLELETQVPFRPISFVEVGEMMKDKRIAPVMTKEDKFYWYAFDK